MASRATRPATTPLDRLWTSGTASGLTDAELLARFCQSKGQAGESAFEALLTRHGPLVYGVCRQVLQNPQDVEDSFQATFLVLVRKARSIRIGASLAPWLYGVAYRTSVRARARSSKNRLMEAEQLEAVALTTPAAGSDQELTAILHDELNRLPEKYRLPLVLCHLQGKTHEEAAECLDWPVGTVSGRLSRGRQLVRQRLERRGWNSAIDLSGMLPPLRFAPNAPARLLNSCTKLVGDLTTRGSCPASIHSLAQGVSRSMRWNQVKLLGSIAAMFSGSALALTVLATGLLAGPPAEPTPPQVKTSKAPAQSTSPAKPARPGKTANEAPADLTIETAPPVVVRTIPEAGATNIDPGLSEIKVVFSKPMQDGSWSWSTASASQETFPEVSGKPRYLDDQKTCVLPVKLQPNRTYAIWLNSEKFHNFKDREQLPAVPYLLVFQTRSEK